MSEPSSEQKVIGGWPTAIFLAATFFAAIAPTLDWLEFGSSMENLVVATALEVRRTEQWLVPTLAAWVSAAAIRCETNIAIDSPDPRVRADAYRKIGWELRWPALAAACLMLLAIYDIGRTVAGARCGIFAMAIAG